MRHRKQTFKMQRTRSHRAALVSNMVTSLFKHEKIRTTDAKAQAVKGIAEHIISVAKRGDLAARRQCAATVKDPAVLRKLFAVLVPRMKDKTSGFVTVTKLWPRPGDAALMALMELHGAPDKPKHEEKPVTKQPKFKKKGEKKAESKKEDKPAKKDEKPAAKEEKKAEKKEKK
ncbi:MAG: 50S ribosomal protein L17 [Candidatus Edwardsbacteria bacterium]|jgi:large subunit ribosomal protein L17|nr:50S ribosomal protein L17 [Candidatus Edwardsbacteria bacterium]